MFFLNLFPAFSFPIRNSYVASSDDIFSVAISSPVRHRLYVYFIRLDSLFNISDKLHVKLLYFLCAIYKLQLFHLAISYIFSAFFAFFCNFLPYSSFLNVLYSKCLSHRIHLWKNCQNTIKVKVTGKH